MTCMNALCDSLIWWKTTRDPECTPTGPGRLPRARLGCNSFYRSLCTDRYFRAFHQPIRPLLRLWRRNKNCRYHRCRQDCRPTAKIHPRNSSRSSSCLSIPFFLLLLSLFLSFDLSSRNFPFLPRWERGGEKKKRKIRPCYRSRNVARESGNRIVVSVWDVFRVEQTMSNSGDVRCASSLSKNISNILLPYPPFFNAPHREEYRNGITCNTSFLPLLKFFQSRNSNCALEH